MKQTSVMSGARFSEEAKWIMGLSFTWSNREGFSFSVSQCEAII